MLKKKLRGTGVAIITPFDSNHQIDFNSLDKVLQHVINGGVDYLVLLGTTSESVTLDIEEKKDILQYVYTHRATQNIPFVVGAGGNDTKAVERLFTKLPLEEATAIMSVSPAYNRPSQQGLFEHYNYLASVAPKPIIMYNVPSRTASTLEAKTVLRLANTNNNIQGIKEANSDISNALEILYNAPENFLLTSGEDTVFWPLLLAGFDGLMSVAANAFPKQISQAVKYSLTHKPEQSKAIMTSVCEAINCMFEENNPAGVKAFLAQMNIIKPHMRLPLVPLSPIVHNKVLEVVKSIKN